MLYLASHTVNSVNDLVKVFFVSFECFCTDSCQTFSPPLSHFVKTRSAQVQMDEVEGLRLRPSSDDLVSLAESINLEGQVVK